MTQQIRDVVIVAIMAFALTAAAPSLLARNYAEASSGIDTVIGGDPSPSAATPQTEQSPTIQTRPAPPPEPATTTQPTQSPTAPTTPAPLPEPAATSPTEQLSTAPTTPAPPPEPADNLQTEQLPTTPPDTGQSSAGLLSTVLIVGIAVLLIAIIFRRRRKPA